MPSIDFVLPHWLYWSGLLLFPLLAMFMLRGRQAGQTADRSVSLPIAYFLLITAGFVGVHRIYLRNYWGLLFVPLFFVLLYANTSASEKRDGISLANNEIAKLEFLLERAEKGLEEGKSGAQQQFEKHSAGLATAQQQLADAEKAQGQWNSWVKIIASVIFIWLIVDALLIPHLKRRCDELDAVDPIHQSTFSCATITAEGGKIRPEKTPFAKAVGALNHFSGSFVAYWSVIAVCVYYYEVIARYVFNSPTNWAHESMFLMFGAQYLMAGGFCLREQAHVRVDVFYMHFSDRKKAWVDLFTSIFFFIFVIALIVTGWTFFMDSFGVREVSFTEWAIQYYPIKLSIAAGALLLLLQGISQLLSDIQTIREASNGH